MSNDIIQSLKNQIASIPQGVDDDTRAVAGAGRFKRISIKGGVFRKMAGSKQVAAIEDRSMNVIFVKMAHTASRTYYPGAYKEGSKTAPVCWSSDAKVPDPEVKTPQASACDKCQWSVKGTGQGGTGTACRLSWRTAVVLPTNPDGDVMQLVIPAASAFGKEENGKWPFRPYIQMLANNNISAGRVVTKMQFDTEASAPRILFSPVAAVDEDATDIIAQQRSSQDAEAAIKLTVFQIEEGGEETEVAPAAAPETVVVEEVAPPTLRAKGDAPAATATNAADVVKKWSKK